MGSNDESAVDSTSKTTVANKKRVETQRRTISPYDLSSSDNPGSVISQPLLNGPNYNDWAGNLRMALKARKKFGFVDGSIPQQSEESGDLEDWWTNNALVVSWIKLTKIESIRSNLSHLEIASDILEHIRRRYSVKNGQRVQSIKVELATCRQQGSTMEEYYGKLMKLWTSFSDIHQTKTCACPAGVSMEKEREEDKLHEFLKGLDESLYGSVKSNMLSRDPLPSLDEAYSAVLQDEDSKHTSRVVNEKMDNMACAARSGSSSGAGRTYPDREERAKLRCTSCGNRGQLAVSCFRTVGYPEWWGDRPKGKPNTSRGRGAAPAQRLVETPRANTVQTFAAASVHSANLIKTLVTFLNERKQPTGTNLTSKFSDHSWIIDSGATNHMTSSLSRLSDTRDIPSLSIKLPDGRFSYASK